MKRFIKYFFILFTTLLIGNTVFANSFKDDVPFGNIKALNNETESFSGLDSDLNTHFKHYFSALEDNQDRIELPETENDTEDSNTSLPFHNFNDYSNFFSGILSGSYITFKEKGLDSCKYTSYLSTIESFHVIFCVFRI
ncbi:hypothetical protein [Flavobacterium enshiense]|uniref:Uncharacterized protein n=1 Tax=Flavobacterium enshiense DK69 TaxID=1107311 RepID=A0A0A2MWT7_9FLAO|nr:hypothetical protein [Flavobacterium enshiense]KGO96809.1 hypothetical protein Q767_03640 [Flavobacterium enshiense DK69]